LLLLLSHKIWMDMKCDDTSTHIHSCDDLQQQQQLQQLPLVLLECGKTKIRIEELKDFHNRSSSASFAFLVLLPLFIIILFIKFFQNPKRVARFSLTGATFPRRLRKCFFS